MTKTYASIDVGSHTARLLAARSSGPSFAPRPLARKRAYIRMMKDAVHKVIGSSAIGRILKAQEGFSRFLWTCDVQSLHDVSTA